MGTNQEFLNYVRRRALARGTIEKRIAIVRWWGAFLAGRGLGIGEASSRDVELFVDSRVHANARTRYALISHLHAFYVWAMRAGICRAATCAS